MKSGDMAIAEYSHFRWLHSFWSHQEPQYHPARTPRFGVLQFGPKVHRNFDAIDDMNRALGCIRLWAGFCCQNPSYSDIMNLPKRSLSNLGTEKM